MTLYNSVILKEGNKFYLKTGSADILNNTILEKLNNVVCFIQNNLYENQIIWHYNTNTPLFEVFIENEIININCPYLKFIYNMPIWKFKIKSLLKEISKEYNIAINNMIVRC